MARQSRVNPSSRRPNTDKDTYDFSTPDLNVSARPTDDYMERRPNRDIVNALEAVNKGLASYGTLSELRSKNAEDRAEKDFAENPEAPPSEQTVAYIEKWEQMKGTHVAIAEFQKEADAYFTQNSHLEPDEFKEGYQKIVAEYTAGRSKNFMLGFFPKALQKEQALFGQYNNVLGERIATQRNEAASQEMRDAVETMVIQHTGARGLADLGDDAFWVKNYAADSNAFQRVCERN